MGFQEFCITFGARGWVLFQFLDSSLQTNRALKMRRDYYSNEKPKQTGQKEVLPT